MEIDCTPKYNVILHYVRLHQENVITVRTPRLDAALHTACIHSCVPQCRVWTSLSTFCA